jgi:hypothetical protein
MRQTALAGVDAEPKQRILIRQSRPKQLGVYGQAS